MGAGTLAKQLSPLDTRRPVGVGFNSVAKKNSRAWTSSGAPDGEPRYAEGSANNDSMP